MKHFKISVIISEFNPFHNGHSHLIAQTRQSGASHIIAIMSGNFVQRGAPACFSKWVRAKAALQSGVDLILELPLPWALSSAHTFALGGVSLANALGCAHQLSFGSEAGAIAPLWQLASLLSSPQFSQYIQAQLKTGATFAAARQSAVAMLTNPQTAALLSQPNNILAVSYCQALRATGSKLVPFTIPRTGAAYHDSAAPQSAIASATQIRHLIAQQQPFSDYLPPQAHTCFADTLHRNAAPASISTIERAVLAKLRTMPLAAFANLPDISEGVEHRLYQAAKQATSLPDLYARVKTKRYTLARIRRLTLSAFLGIQSAHTTLSPPYLRVLGFSPAGKELLPLLKQTASLPLFTNAARCHALSPQAQAIFALEAASSDLYALTLPQPGPCGLEYTQPIITPMNER